MRQHQIVRLGIALVIAPLLMVAMLLAALPVLAAPATYGTANNSETMTVSSWDTTPFIYASQSVPTFKVIVTFAMPPSDTNSFDVTMQVNGTGSLYGSCCNPTASPDGLTYTYKVPMSWTVIPPGNDSAIATYTDPSTHATIQSSPYTFSVGKGIPSMQCMITNWNQVVGAGYTLNFQMTPESGDPSSPVDWQNATYTVAFLGPATVTQSNLTPNSSDVVAVPAPTQYGRYTTVNCTFNGTNLFTSATTNAAGQPVLVSREQQLGSVELFTNPTTLASNQPSDMYIVFHAASAGPTPTGSFGITLGRYYTPAQSIGSDGTLLVHTAQMPNLNGVSQITISYFGDPYYNQDVVNFPLTNPPIPGGGSGGGGGGGGRPSNTPSATPKSSPTVLANGSGSFATPPTVAPATPLLGSTQASQSSGVLWLIVLLGLLVVGSGIAGGIVVVLRSRASTSAAGQAAHTIAPPPSKWREIAPPSESEQDTEW